MIDMYVVDSESKYHIRVKKIVNIEDAGDDFMTEHEVREAIGLDDGEEISTYGPICRNQLVIDTLNDLKSTMIEKKKKSMIITDHDLVAFLELGYCISHFVPGLRRVGNRISLHEKAEKSKPTKRNFQNFVSHACNMISKKYGVVMSITYADQNYSGSIEFIKKLVTIEEIDDWAELNNVSDWIDDSVWFKHIWDNPNQFD